MPARTQPACGGAEKVVEMKDATRTATIDRGGAARSGRQVRTEQWLMPRHFREETGAARYTIYTNGTGGVVTDGVHCNPLRGALDDQVHAELFGFNRRVRLGDVVPERTVFGVDGDAVEVREGTQSTRQGGLRSEILYETTSNNGLPVVVEEVLEDFRVGGWRQMPFRVQILNNGQPAAVVTVHELKVNSGLKVEDRAKRQ